MSAKRQVPDYPFLMKKKESITAFILAGGKSKRFGSDKAALEYRGKKFIDITIESVAAVIPAVHLVGRTYEHPQLSGSLPDEINGIGPIGGMYTALKHTDTDLNFFVGIDYPFIDPAVIQYLLREMHTAGSNCDGLVPVLPDGVHPLFALYRKGCLNSTIRCISEKNYSLRCIARSSNIYFLRISSRIKAPPFSSLVKNFININYYTDYTKFIR